MRPTEWSFVIECAACATRRDCKGNPSLPARRSLDLLFRAVVMLIDLIAPLHRYTRSPSEKSSPSGVGCECLRCSERIVEFETSARACRGGEVKRSSSCSGIESLAEVSVRGENALTASRCEVEVECAQTELSCNLPAQLRQRTHVAFVESTAPSSVVAYFVGATVIRDADSLVCHGCGEGVC